MSYNDLKFIFCTPDNTTRHIFDLKSRKNMTVVIPSSRVTHFTGIEDFILNFSKRLLNSDQKLNIILS